MALVALHSAATGLSALSTDLDVISNNLANVNTNGFKSARTNFENLLYEEKQQPGVENTNGDQRPAGLYVGLGVRVSNTQFDFTQGAPLNTGGDLDMMVNGTGFFRVAVPDNVGDGIAYTRAGNFFRNSQGEIVLGNSDGPRLDPPIVLPQEVTEVVISNDGRVMGKAPADLEFAEFGQIQLATFVNTGGLTPIAGNLYIETEGSGPAIVGDPGEGVFGSILHKFMENSNVDPVKELVNLIRTQRAFEMNSQSIKAADDALQVIANLKRF